MEELKELEKDVRELQEKIPQIESLRARMFWNWLAYDILLALGLANLAVGIIRLILIR